MVKLSFLRVILLGLVRIEDFDLMFHGLGGLAGKGAGIRRLPPHILTSRLLVVSRMNLRSFLKAPWSGAGEEKKVGK